MLVSHLSPMLVPGSFTGELADSAAAAGKTELLLLFSDQTGTCWVRNKVGDGGVCAMRSSREGGEVWGLIH